MYWNESNFEGLKELALRLAGDPLLAQYAEYLRLREQGLRQEAFAALHRFVSFAIALSFEQRRDMVDRLMILNFRHPEVNHLIPDPLRKDLITPTLGE